MISYAQNGEDVMLWRALKTVRHGFYLDVGANDPVEDSVTKAFYDSGWHGINIEPLAVHYSDLLIQRPRDINLKCAAGSEEGEVSLWVPMRRGWASASETAVARHRAHGHEGAYEVVAQTTLTTILQQYQPAEIHFLKIDVEGYELEVIRGIDLKQFRPWIILAEATMPDSREEVYDCWEPLLLAADYRFCYFDGANRFYIAAEHATLMRYFTSPPNVLDDWRSWREVSLEQNLEKARDNLIDSARQLVAERDAALQANNLIRLLAEERARHIVALHHSTSWRVTAPLRFAGRAIRAMFSPQKIVSCIRDPFGHARLFISRRPKLKALIPQRVRQAVRLRQNAALHQGGGASLSPQTPVAEIRLSITELKAFNGWLDALLAASSGSRCRILVIRGDLNSHNGYARACSLYADLLADRFDAVLGADIHAHPSRAFKVWRHRSVDDAFIALLAGRATVALTVMTISSPDNFAVIDGSTNIGLFFWETNRLGNGWWIEKMNQLNAVWVPGAFMKPMLECEGVTVPVHHVACPLDFAPDEENYQAVDSLQLKRISSHSSTLSTMAFTTVRARHQRIFLSINSFIPRKGFPVLFSEWASVARRYPDVALVIKTSSLDVGESQQSLLGRLQQMWTQIAGRDGPEVKLYVISQSLSQEALQALIRACDAFVTTSYGEGLGLGVFESLWAGKPAICARHTSFEELLPADYRWFLATEFANFGVADPVGVYPISARWGVPQEGALLATLQQLLADWEAGLADEHVGRTVEWVKHHYRPVLPEVP